MKKNIRDLAESIPNDDKEKESILLAELLREAAELREETDELARQISNAVETPDPKKE